MSVKIKFEVELDPDLVGTIILMCDKLDLDYEELLEFLVVYAKSSLPLFKDI